LDTFKGTFGIEKKDFLYSANYSFLSSSIERIIVIIDNVENSIIVVVKVDIP